MKKPILMAGMLFSFFLLAGAAGSQPVISVDGIVESETGGFKFPDGTVQATASGPDEVRTPISSLPFPISQSGAYYLTSNLTMTAGGDAIPVTADDVTIDLMGFVLNGGDVGTRGVSATAQNNIEVRNGTVRDFSSHGIELDGMGHRIVEVRLTGSDSGVRLTGASHLVRGCTAFGNSGYGIYAGGTGNTVIGNTASGNGNDGVLTGTGSTIRNNTSYDNQGEGIDGGFGTTITGNTSYMNGSAGIEANRGSLVVDNTVRDNNQDSDALKGGIVVFGDTLVKGNSLRGNLLANIRISGEGNSIEENLVTNSANGLSFGEFSGVNFYANNRSAANTTAYNENGSTQTDGGGNVVF